MLLGAIVVAGCVSWGSAAPAWGQNGGGRTRAGVWPPTRFSGNVGEAHSPALDAVTAPQSTPGELRVEQPLGTPYPFIYPSVRAAESDVSRVTHPRPFLATLTVPHCHPLQKVYQYEATLTSEPILSKTTCAVVASTGNVIAALPTAQVVNLANPDSGTGGNNPWAKPIWEVDDAANSAENPVTGDPLATDLVLDNNDNVFLVVQDRNNYLKGTDGNLFGWDKSGNTLPWALNGMLSLVANLRQFALYHISLLVGPSTPTGTSGASPFARLFMGINTLVSQRGVAIASTDSTCSIDSTQSPPCWGNPGTGAPTPTPGPLPSKPTCCLNSPAIDTDSFGSLVNAAYLDGVGAIGLLAHSFGAKGAAIAAYDEAGNQLWVSPVQFVSQNNQPPPTIDPYTQNVYWIGVLQS